MEMLSAELRWKTGSGLLFYAQLDVLMVIHVELCVIIVLFNE